jgi:hypothetical protein
MKYGCRICKKEVKPKNGRLVCCGHNEAVPTPRLRCNTCRGVLDYRTTDEFLGTRQCLCGEYMHDNYDDDYGDW